jgi:hypothetical protein
MFTADGPDCCGRDPVRQPGRSRPVYASTICRRPAHRLVASRPGCSRRAGATCTRDTSVTCVVVGGNRGHRRRGAYRRRGRAAYRGRPGQPGDAWPSTSPPVLAARPEIMVHAVDEAADWTTCCVQAERHRDRARDSGATTGRVGCGSARWRADRPLIVDADALAPAGRSRAVRRDDWVLTPHPGEAAALLGLCCRCRDPGRPVRCRWRGCSRASAAASCSRVAAA